MRGVPDGFRQIETPPIYAERLGDDGKVVVFESDDAEVQAPGGPGHYVITVTVYKHDADSPESAVGLDAAPDAKPVDLGSASAWSDEHSVMTKTLDGAGEVDVPISSIFVAGDSIAMTVVGEGLDAESVQAIAASVEVG